MVSTVTVYGIRTMGDIGSMMSEFGEVEKLSPTYFILKVKSKPDKEKSIIGLLNSPSVITSDVIQKEIHYDDGSVEESSNR
ncbi:hypothetical protein [[Eubacterium] cellulosolvens]